MNDEKKENVVQLSALEGLRMFHNTHLEKFLAHKINAIMFSEMKPDEVVQVFVQPSNQPGIPGVERKIKAKERLASETKMRNNQEHILRVIDRLIKEEEKNA